MKSGFRIIASFCFVATALFGGPLSSANLGTPRYISLDSWPYPTSNGGGFSGRVGDLAPGSGNLLDPSVTTTFWCVDSQLHFGFGYQGWANLVSLSNVASNPNSVRYGTINDHTTADLDPGWTNSTVGGNSLSDAAVNRYAMAAYLVSQYSGFPNGPNANNTANTNIQSAIWTITHNSTTPNDGAGTSAITGTVGTVGSIAYWVDQARQNYNTVNLNAWAVVSWLTDVNGVLQTQSGSTSGDARQTFLVQVVPPPGSGDFSNVPEPGFYGALTFGTAALLWLRQRRQVKS